MEYQEKCASLHELMDRYTKRNAAVAFSGGADSSLLLKLAVLHAGENGTRVYAVNVSTELHPSVDAEIAERIAEETGADYISLSVSELDHAGMKSNPIDRCYRCKKYLFGKILETATQLQAEVIMEGTNTDDLLAYRPGIRAVEELRIKSPLREAGFTKEEVRRLAAEYGISAAERPAAPCLATRFPYGEELTVEKMKRVEQGEAWLKELGLYNVRLRVHSSKTAGKDGAVCQEIVRIEVDDCYFHKILERKKEIAAYLKQLGYAYITLDLEGFRSGSMDLEIHHK